MISKSTIIIFSLWLIVVIGDLIPTLTNMFTGFQVLKILDEVFIICLFLYVVFTKPQKVIFLLLLLLFLLAGVYSGQINGASSNVMLKGSFLSIKGFLLAYSLSLVSLSKQDLQLFFNLYKPILYLSVFFFLLDQLSGISLKEALDLKIEERAGFQVANSFFRHPVQLVFFSFFWLYYFVAFGKSKLHKLVVLSMGILTFRIKEIASVIFSLALNLKRRRRFVKLILVSGISVSMIVFLYIKILPEHYGIYFGQNENPVARIVLYLTSFSIGLGNFPFGEGFGRFGGEVSSNPYSPVYFEYGISNVFGLNPKHPENYISDTFWPMILGETGFLGLALYLSIFIYLVRFSFSRRNLRHISQEMFFIRLTIISSVVISLAHPIYSGSPTYFIIFGMIGIVRSINLQESKVQNRS